VASVYVRAGSTWLRESDLVPNVTEPPRAFVQPRVLAVSGDGSRAVVGQPFVGYVSVFVRSGSTWQLAQTLHGFPNTGFGVSVAMDASGDRVVVGVYYDAQVASGVESGSAHVYVLRDGAYRRERVLFPDDDGTNGGFGRSVAMSADGTRVVAGAPASTAPGGTLGAGAAFAFTLTL
jgi:hypothetical protein